MSIARNFRVIVNLSNFFHDHRSRARVFINDDVQKISDLEDRIKKIFNIKNFHLTSQNEFLPPSEDARILQKDDIVWVIQNGQNIEPIGTPKASHNKSDKLKIDNRKRSISDDLIEEESYLPKKKNKKYHANKDGEDSSIISNPTTDEPKKKKGSKLPDNIIEEELHSQKKKKNKTYEVNKNKEDFCSIPDHIADEPKKKKKKKDNYLYSYNAETTSEDLNKETFESPVQQTTNNKSTADVSNNKVSTTINEAEFNSSKTNVMNINSLLPVLQSHIDTYNKKISTSQLNKTNSNLNDTSSSPSFTKQSKSDEKKQCKGNLIFYKRKLQLPTITDEYLNQKKINIVKIECLGSAQTEISKQKDNNEVKRKIPYKETQNAFHDLNVATSDGISEMEVSEAMTLLDKRLDVNVSKNTTTEEISPVRGVESNKMLGNDSSLNSAIIKSVEKNISKDIGPTSKPQDKLGIIKIISSSNIQKSQSKLEINGTQLSSQFSKGSGLVKNDETTATKGHGMNETNKTNNDDLRTLVDTSEELLGKTVATKIFAANAPSKSVFQQYDTVPGKENSVSYKNVYPFFFKQEVIHVNSTTSDKCTADDIQMEETSPENIPDQTEPENMSKISHISEKKEFGEEINLSHVDHSYSDIGCAKSTGNPSLLKENSANEVNSMFQNTDTSAMDITETIARDVDGSETSATIGKNMSKSYTRKQQAGVGQLLEELRGNETVESVETVDSDCSEFITKRRRKRVRKRKKKHVPYIFDSSLDNSSIIITEPPVHRKPLNTIACPSIHIKFDDDDEAEIKDKSTTIIADETYIECVSLRSDLDESKTDKPSIKDEEIVKSPSMRNMLPKIADLVAFKVLRITNNYTPDISSYITGKVLEFDSVSKRIVFQILSGLDQCGEPKGKFSLEADQSVKTSGSDRREFIWDDLIDPRLLYP